VTTSDGRKFGLKAARGDPRYEEVISEIARTVKCPNASRCVADPHWTVHEVAGLVGRSVAKIEWLAGKVGNLNSPSTLNCIRSKLASFNQQYGEWCALGLLLGVDDRDNPGNWVWDCQRARLQMIDFEYSFSVTRNPSQYTRLLLRRDVSLADRDRWLSDPLSYPPGFRDGFLRMRKKIRTSIGGIRATLRQVTGPEHVDSLVSYANLRDSDAFDEVIRTL
jgi:hypothetical protein